MATRHLRGKKGRQDIADDTADCVDRKNVESIVAAEEILELGSIVAGDATAHAKNNSRPRGYKAGSGSNANQASNDTRAETHSRPLALQAIVDQTPGDAAGASSEVSDDSGHDGTQVGGEGGTGIESEPSYPEEDGSDDNVGDIVRPVVEFLGAVAPSLA